MKRNTIKSSLDATIAYTSGTVEDRHLHSPPGPLLGPVVGVDPGLAAGGDDGQVGGGGVEGEVI